MLPLINKSKWFTGFCLLFFGRFVKITDLSNFFLGSYHVSGSVLGSEIAMIDMSPALIKWER